MLWRKSAGFTLIELLVVVVVIAILAAIAVPNYVGASKKAKVATVKANMHSCQLAAESFAVDSGGAYSDSGPPLVTYYAASRLPTNPITGVPNETLASSSLTSLSTIQTARQSAAPASYGAGAGQTAYIGFNSAPIGKTDCYSITGGDDQGNAVLGSLGHLILAGE